MENKSLKIVGFSYDVSDIRSKKTSMTKRDIGRKTTQKIELAHGYNWSDEHLLGYGRANAYKSDIGPFYSIVGGYTDYANENSSSANIKGNKWGVETIDKFCLFEGYCWNHFLNSKGYCRNYIYVIEDINSDNILGSRIQSTSENSQSPWIETSLFGKKNDKETIWGSCYGWSEQYGNGYNHFSFYHQKQKAKEEVTFDYQTYTEESPPSYHLAYKN
ncbi:MAG: hypothetical protein AD073_000274 [Mycoplasmataceae bacterium]|nr:MAG: hypothetical protein AD073_000274 [Mycoplasmataceae bacterium]